MTLLGFVSKETLYSLYAKASVYVQPSLYEPFGIMILEAMSMRKPVIATRVGGIPEVINNGENGILVEPGNSVQLAEAIIRIFSDPSLAEFLATNGRNRVQTEFSWKSIASKTLKVYENLT